MVFKSQQQQSASSFLCLEVIPGEEVHHILD